MTAPIGFVFGVVFSEQMAQRSSFSNFCNHFRLPEVRLAFTERKAMAP
jgi:hypothetical protein